MLLTLGQANRTRMRITSLYFLPGLRRQLASILFRMEPNLVMVCSIRFGLTSVDSTPSSKFGWQPTHPLVHPVLLFHVLSIYGERLTYRLYIMSALVATIATRELAMLQRCLWRRHFIFRMLDDRRTSSQILVLFTLAAQRKVYQVFVHLPAAPRILAV